MSLLRSSLIVSTLSLAGSLLSFVNQLVVARSFGASASMDAYLLASSVPTLVSGCVVAVFSYSLVPTIMAHRAAGSAREFVSCYLRILAGGAVLLAVVGYWISPAMVSALGAELPTLARDAATVMARVSWVAAALTILAGFFSSVQNSRKRFYSPVLAGMLPYLGMIVCCLACGARMGPVALVWGLAAGSALQLVLLGFLGTEETPGKRHSPTTEVVNHLKQMPPVLVAMSCFTIYQSVDSYWAPQIGTGNLSYLGYCQRLLIAVGNLVIAGPSVVLVPRLTEASLAGRHEQFRAELALALRMVLACAVPAGTILSVLSVPAVELLFQRGAFDGTATRGVASLLPFMMAGMVPMLCVVITFRALFARQSVRAATVLGVAATVSYFSLSGLLSVRYGARGIGLAYAVSWTIVFMLGMVILFHEQLSRKKVAGVARFALRLGLASAAAGMAAFGVKSAMIVPLGNGSWVDLLLRTSVAAIAGGASYLLMALGWFQIPEVTMLTESVAQMVIPWKVRGREKKRG